MRRYTFIGEPQLFPHLFASLFLFFAYNDVKKQHFFLLCVFYFMSVMSGVL